MKFLLLLLLILPLSIFSQQLQQPTSIKTTATPATSNSKVLRFRCSNTIATDKPPLILINSYIVQDSLLSKISPALIQSIEVIKNANATKEYGERAKNGVISITVKPEYFVTLIDKGIIKPIL